MAKKRVSKKSPTKVGTKNNLSTKNLLIIIIVIAVILFLISSYTGNVARRSSASANSFRNSGALPSSGSGGSRDSGPKIPPPQPVEEGGVPCNNENIQLTGRTKCNTGSSQVMEEFSCPGRNNAWRTSTTCRPNQICQVNGDSASCVECENTVTHECPTRSQSSFSVTRDCRGQEVSRVRNNIILTCENSIASVEYYRCSNGEATLRNSEYNCPNGCDAQGTDCCWSIISDAICEGNNLMNVTTNNCLRQEISRVRIGEC